MKNSNIKKLYALLIIAVLFITTTKAQIIYTDVNPDSITTTGSPNTIKTYGLDLNNDGTVDFNILTKRVLGYYIGSRLIEMVTPLHKNQVLDTFPGAAYFAVSLGLNRYVGPNLLWRNDSNQSLIIANGLPGYWSFNTDAFLGLKIVVGSDTSYGWVRLLLQKYGTGYGMTYSSTIKDYAYNSIPNQPILAGETSCTTPSVNLTQSGPLSFCAGDSVTLTANGTGYQYQWKKNNVNISGATAKTYTAKTAGIYKCKVTNSCGSKTSAGKTVTVPCRMANDNFSETSEHLSVYPNPSTNSVTIKFATDEAGEIQIVNLFGQIVFSEKIITEQTQIDVSRFSAGMYLVRWSSGVNNETKTFSVVK